MHLCSCFSFLTNTHTPVQCCCLIVNEPGNETGNRMGRNGWPPKAKVREPFPERRWQSEQKWSGEAYFEILSLGMKWKNAGVPDCIEIKLLEIKLLQAPRESSVKCSQEREEFSFQVTYDCGTFASNAASLCAFTCEKFSSYTPNLPLQASMKYIKWKVICLGHLDL